MTPPIASERRPLFSFWVLAVVATFVASGLLSWIWPATTVRGWSLRLVMATYITTGLAVYVIGEPIRCRIRISIKVLLAIVALVAVCCAMFANRLVNAGEQRRCVRQINARGGFVRYEFDQGWGSGFKTKEGWLFPKWMLKVLGNDVFGEVTAVYFRSPGIVDDEVLTQLATLDQVTDLDLHVTKVSDDGLRILGSLSNLEVLLLDETMVSDAGLVHLKQHRRLRCVTVRYTAVTDEGVAELRKALPMCQVVTGTY